MLCKIGIHRWEYSFKDCKKELEEYLSKKVAYSLYSNRTLEDYPIKQLYYDSKYGRGEPIIKKLPNSFVDHHLKHNPSMDIFQKQRVCQRCYKKQVLSFENNGVEESLIWKTAELDNSELRDFKINELLK